jgi:hypothetical protein
VYLIYVDESGDCGMVNSPSSHFALTGLVVHELRWQATLDQFIEFRRSIGREFGVRVREELHAGPMVGRSGPLARIPKSDRLAIIRAGHPAERQRLA